MIQDLNWTSRITAWPCSIQVTTTSLPYILSTLSKLEPSPLSQQCWGNSFLLQRIQLSALFQCQTTGDLCISVLWVFCACYQSATDSHILTSCMVYAGCVSMAGIQWFTHRGHEYLDLYHLYEWWNKCMNRFKKKNFFLNCYSSQEVRGCCLCSLLHSSDQATNTPAG